MRTLIFWLSALIILNSSQSFGQIDTTLKEFYPLHLRDLWQYRDEMNNLYTRQVAIQDTLLPNGYHYAGIGVPPNFTTGYDFVRIDSLLRVEHYGASFDTLGGTNSEYSVYRLNEQVGTYWELLRDIVNTVCSPHYMRYGGITSGTFGGESREFMHFWPGAYCSDIGDTVWYGVDWTLVRGIGITYQETIESSFKYLTGAIIDGITYGTIVRVDDAPSLIGSQFILEQNYPNPFNPETVIRYELPKESDVTLKIYDLLGKEIAIIVDQRELPGRYQKTVNARNIANGVYFYRLTTGLNTLTRTMCVIK